MKLNPLHDRVVVKRVEAEKTTSSGLIIPDNVAEKPDRGIVLAVGTGYLTPEGTVIPMTVAVNDQVLFGKQSGELVKIEGEDLLVMKESEIYAIVEGE